MANYCEISRGEMAALLEPAGFKPIIVPNCFEVVWELQFKGNPRLAWRVFSSITGEYSRGCGADAIRVVVWDLSIDKPITGACRTNRIPGWQDRLKAKIREVGHGLKLVKCPDCGSYMIKRKGKNGEFLGCSRFPACRKTMAAR